MSEGGGDGWAAQELVQVEAHGQGGQALHVGAVDQLLPTDHMRLEAEEQQEP